MSQPWVCVCGRSVSCCWKNTGHINAPGMLFSKTEWGQSHHYSLRHASATSAVTTAGERLIFTVGIGWYVDFYRRKVLGDLNVNLFSVVCGIETRNHVQNSKWATALEFSEEMGFKKKNTAACLQSNHLTCKWKEYILPNFLYRKEIMHINKKAF